MGGTYSKEEREGYKLNDTDNAAVSTQMLKKQPLTTATGGFALLLLPQLTSKHIIRATGKSLVSKQERSDYHSMFISDLKNGVRPTSLVCVYGGVGRP